MVWEQPDGTCIVQGGWAAAAVDSLDTQHPDRKGCPSLLALDRKMKQRAVKNSFVFNHQQRW